MIITVDEQISPTSNPMNSGMNYPPTGADFVHPPYQHLERPPAVKRRLHNKHVSLSTIDVSPGFAPKWLVCFCFLLPPPNSLFVLLKIGLHPVLSVARLQVPSGPEARGIKPVPLGGSSRSAHGLMG